MESNQNKAAKSISKQNLLIVVCVSILVVVAAVLISLQLINGPKTQIGAKTITVEVIGNDGVSKEYTINTDEEFLRGALEQDNLVSGDESEFGLFVTSVDGETADIANREWWCFTKDGEMLMTGIDETPIEDGDHFEITLSTY